MVEFHFTCHVCRSVPHTERNPEASLWINTVDVIPGPLHFEPGAHRARGSLIFRATKDDPPHMSPHQRTCSTFTHFHSHMLLLSPKPYPASTVRGIGKSLWVICLGIRFFFFFCILVKQGYKVHRTSRCLLQHTSDIFRWNTGLSLPGWSIWLKGRNKISSEKSNLS